MNVNVGVEVRVGVPVAVGTIVAVNVGVAVGGTPNVYVSMTVPVRVMN